MGMLKFIIYYLAFSYIWKTAAYAAQTQSINALAFAIGCAFAIIVWPHPLFRPKPNDGGMNDKGV